MYPIFLNQSIKIESFDKFSYSHVSIETIAGNLSRLCRFNGACGVFYSVAEHSVIVSRIVEDSAAKAALLHDAGEAYYGDVTRPVKHALGDFKEVSEPVDQAIESAFRIRDYVRAYGSRIQQADDLLLAVECHKFFNHPLPNYNIMKESYDKIESMIQCVNPHEALELFKRRWKDVQ